MKTVGNVLLILILTLILLGVIGTEYAHTVEKLRQVSNALETARSRIAQLQTDIDNLTKNAQTQQVQNAALQDELQDVITGNTNLLGELNASKRANKELEGQLDPTLTENKRLRDELAAYTVEASLIEEQELQPKHRSLQYPPYIVAGVALLFLTPIVGSKYIIKTPKPTENWSVERRRQEIEKARKREREIRQQRLQNPT